MEQPEENFLSNKQRYNFIMAVLPIIDVCLILAIVLTALHPYWCAFFSLLVPVTGMIVTKLGERSNKNTVWLSIIINYFNGFMVCWLAGPNSPSYLLGMSFIVVACLLVKNIKKVILSIAVTFIVIITGSYLGGKTWLDICIGLIVLITYAIFLFRFLQLVLYQGKKIEEQKKLIQLKNLEIIDSITYAKRIQDAILPPIESIRQKLQNSFVLFKPKDIVAGDFYWMEETNNTVFIAAADCTGHGVPGAMVSVVCSNALNRAVKEFDLTVTGKILDKVTDLVLETFEKSSADVKDGMDISLLSINKNTKQVNWSGANNPLWYFENGKPKEITADKQPVGKNDHRKPFTTHTIECNHPTTFYLFTDGYADQFGGPKGKKFKYKQFQETLFNTLEKEPEKQLENLDSVFNKWKGDLEQVDDVCVIGIRL